MKFSTKLLHAGIEPDPSTGAIMTPIFQSSTYVQDAPGVHKGYEYARTQNPTRKALEDNLTALEGGYGASCFSSGLGAMDAIMKLLLPGDEVIVTNDLYGGSYRLMTKIYARYGIKFHFVGMNDAGNITKHINNKTKMIWLETPSNPMLNIIDIKKISSFSRLDIKVVVDNTFASPFLQQPLSLGADIVLHSATKYLGGHSDVVLGAVICKDEATHNEIRFYQNAAGAIPGPQDCFLVLRGIKTLHVRVQRACENAQKIVDFLVENEKVANVYYPGRAEHKNHEIAAKQMKMFGAMVSFDLKDDTIVAANKILKNTQYFALAESLGGVESLISHPSTMTHSSIPRGERLKVGLTDSLIRLSVGIEDIEDLLEDLKNVLSK